MSYAKLQSPLGGSDLGMPSGLRPLSGVEATAEVLTRKGYKAAAQLSSRDDVITRDKGILSIRDITRRTERSRMVRFAAEALGTDRPEQDLVLPARQLVLVRDWRAEALFGRHEAYVQAAALIDDQYITDDGMHQLDCVQIWLEAPSVLYVRGMAVLSAHGFDAALQPQA
ncbi:Hint domain-containing protein [Tritonibacter mobilis]|uniref:Hint domain-containing protein n=1 Tax=Tritonibacter mobilis TaxID=379347 RepID=UPI0039A563E2